MDTAHEDGEFERVTGECPGGDITAAIIEFPGQVADASRRLTKGKLATTIRLLDGSEQEVDPEELRPEAEGSNGNFRITHKNILIGGAIGAALLAAGFAIRHAQQKKN